jgi:hypothetical protein
MVFLNVDENLWSETTVPLYTTSQTHTLNSNPSQSDTDKHNNTQPEQHPQPSTSSINLSIFPRRNSYFLYVLPLLPPLRYPAPLYPPTSQDPYSTPSPPRIKSMPSFYYSDDPKAYDVGDCSTGAEKQRGYWRKKWWGNVGSSFG